MKGMAGFGMEAVTMDGMTGFGRYFNVESMMCCGLNGGSLKKYVYILTLGTHAHELIWKRVFADGLG